MRGAVAPDLKLVSPVPELPRERPANAVPLPQGIAAAPLIEIANERLDLDMPTRMFTYGCRIAPDAMHFGHLSGCTYSENGSWRKMDIQHGRFTEIRADATQVWPFLVRYVMERISS